MTDAESALFTLSVQVRSFAINGSGALTTLFSQVGRAKGPKDAAAIADGRAFLVAKLGTEDKVKAIENAINDLGQWATNNLK